MIYIFSTNQRCLYKGKIDVIKALITHVRVDFKVNKKPRQTLWRLKKELLGIGLPKKIVMKLYYPE